MSREFKVYITDGIVVNVEGLEENERCINLDTLLIQYGVMSDDERINLFNKTLIDSNVGLILLTDNNIVQRYKPEDSKLDIEIINTDDEQFIKLAHQLHDNYIAKETL